MKLHTLTVLQHVFFFLLVIGVLVLSSLLIGIIKHIEHNVSVLAFPESSGLISLVHKNSKVAFILLIMMIVIMALFIFYYFFVMLSSGKREIHLCASLIKQMEATQQSERKSMNKSLAFASASHDVRAALAAITGLIEISYHEVARGSEMETNLKQLDACAKDLLGILNSILDTSKIEAGKMQLEEEEFDVAQLLEDAVDLYHPLGLKKGIDVVLDPHDRSILKFARVKGDRGRLKQILCNLLSNAVKFTSEGHVTVRAWVQKPNFNNSITATSDPSGAVLKHLLCCFFHNDKKKKNTLVQDDDVEAMNCGVQHDPNYLEFVFEVDDTGKGIPKEKQKAVFENYVQVNEIALAGGGTGLGLGIVQSLVRLMHGEIGIVDKEIGERGTCFRFNVLLSSVSENVYKDITKEEDIELRLLTPIHRTSPSPGRVSIHTPSPRLNMIRTPSPKPEGSSVVLLLKNEERRRIAHKFMESLGIKVLALQQWEQLPHILKKIKHMKGKVYHSQGGHALARFILLVIDTTVGPFPELCKMVNDFKRDLQNARCKIVWLANPLMSHNNDLFDISEEDVVKHKALHGTRLFEVVRLLPEFGGAVLPKRSDSEGTSKYQFHTTDNDSGKLQDRRGSGIETPLGEKILSSPTLNRSHVGSRSRKSAVLVDDQQLPHGETVIQEQVQHGINPSRPLSGKKFLVVEDMVVLRTLAMKALENLGANVKLCENGREAVELVCNHLVNQRKHGYDYILMDCQMPEMDGFEATRQIRKEEKSYEVRIPIIALTAHTCTPGDETSKVIEAAGMDHYLGKPLNVDRLLKTLEKFHGTHYTQRTIRRI